MLSGTELGRLVAALCVLPGLRDRGSRDLYVDALERELGTGLLIRRQADTQHDVWAIVEACLAYDGAIPVLLELLDAFHAGSRPMVRLRRLAAELFRDRPADVSGVEPAGVTPVRRHRRHPREHVSGRVRPWWSSMADPVRCPLCDTSEP